MKRLAAVFLLASAIRVWATPNPLACVALPGERAGEAVINCLVDETQVIPESLVFLEGHTVQAPAPNPDSGKTAVTTPGFRPISTRLKMPSDDSGGVPLLISAALKGRLHRVLLRVPFAPVRVVPTPVSNPSYFPQTGIITPSSSSKFFTANHDLFDTLQPMVLLGRLPNAVITFDDFQDSQAITNQAANCQFTNAAALMAGVSLNEFEFPPHSSPTVVIDNNGPITITFSPPVLSFGGYFTYTNALSITAYDLKGHIIGSAASQFASNMMLSGVAGSSPNEFMHILAPAVNDGISTITITGALTGNSFAMDDLQLSIPGYPRDFRGIGRADAALYDPTVGQEYTALSNANGSYSYTPNLFTSAFDTLRTGDFNGDGKADMILYNSHTALAYIGVSNGDGTWAFQSLFWSPNYDIIDMGDLNGDRRTDVALYNSSTGTMYTGISNGDGTFTYKYTLISRAYTVLRLADFTGDGKGDIFLYRASDGLAFIGIGDGVGAFSFQPLFISPGYNLIDIGDLNGDGKADVILYNSSNGNAATGISDGIGGFSFTPQLFSPGFTSVRLADHTGDSKANVTVYNKNTSIAYFGTGTGTGAFNFQSLFWSAGYDYILPEDVDGDGKIDVILYNSATGTQYTGISNGDGTFAYTYWYWGIGKVLAR